MIWSDIPGWFDFGDLYDQAVASAVDGDTFVEIGCWLGASTAYLAGAVKVSGKAVSVVAVDTFQGTTGAEPVAQALYPAILAAYDGDLYPSFLENMRACGVAEIVRPLRMLSADAALEFADGSVAFVFIDGAHDAASVRTDIAAWFPKLRPGCALAGHDIDFPGVLEAVSERFGDAFERVSQRSWLVRK